MTLLTVKSTKASFKITFKFPTLSENSSIEILKKGFRVVNSSNIPPMNQCERVMFQGFLERSISNI